MGTKSDFVVETIDDDNGETADGGDHECPLFMDGLPSDFATNPQLAAIASLLESDDDDPEKRQKPPVNLGYSARQPQAGGGKARSIKCRVRRQALMSHYPLPDKPKPMKPTLGEAHLFLKMWKI
jgi:hypothetical protein